MFAIHGLNILKSFKNVGEITKLVENFLQKKRAKKLEMYAVFLEFLVT